MNSYEQTQKLMKKMKHEKNINKMLKSLNNGKFDDINKI